MLKFSFIQARRFFNNETSISAFNNQKRTDVKQMLDTNSPNYKKALRVERITNNTYTDIKFDIHL